MRQILQRRRRRVVLVLGFGLLALLLLLRPTPTRQFDTVAVSRGDVVQTVRAYGTVKPLQSVQLGAEVSGQVASVSVDLNSRVAQGQELARISSIALTAALERADAEIAAGQAQVQLREAEVARASRIVESRNKLLSRQQDLVKQGFIAETASDESHLEAATAHSELKASHAQLNLATHQLMRSRAQRAEALAALERTRILSPISGIVISKQADVGQTLAATFQTPILFEVVSDLKKMRLEVRVDEADIGGVTIGQPLSFAIDAFPGVDFPGVVTDVQRQGRIADGAISFTVLATFDNTDERVLPGMTANVRIQTGVKRDVLRLPVGALLFSPTTEAASQGLSLPRVSIISKAEADRQRRGAPQAAATKNSGNTVWRHIESSVAPLEPVDVKLGLRGDDYVEVQGQGLAIGEPIVLRERR